MKNILLIVVGFFLFIQLCKMNSTDSENLYTLHTKDGKLLCNYHNSRDLNNDWMVYYDHKTKEQEYIEYWKVDSITVHTENFWICGPRDKKMKYIDLKTKD